MKTIKKLAKKEKQFLCFYPKNWNCFKKVFIIAAAKGLKKLSSRKNLNNSFNSIFRESLNKREN